MVLSPITTGVCVAVLSHSFIRRLHENFKQISYPSNNDLEECSVVYFGIGLALEYVNVMQLRISV
jgi:hypothetical protein